jgi:hypothetical protein
MKFLSFLFTIFFVGGIHAFSVAQSDSIAYRVIADTTVKDTLPPTLFVAGISLYGNDKTKDFIIRREIPFKEGDTLRTEKLIKDLEVAKRQLVNTSLFLGRFCLHTKQVWPVCFYNRVRKRAMVYFAITILQVYRP